MRFIQRLSSTKFIMGIISLAAGVATQSVAPSGLNWELTTLIIFIYSTYAASNWAITTSQFKASNSGTDSSAALRAEIDKLSLDVAGAVGTVENTLKQQNDAIIKLAEDNAKTRTILNAR